MQGDGARSESGPAFAMRYVRASVLRRRVTSSNRAKFTMRKECWVSGSTLIMSVFYKMRVKVEVAQAGRRQKEE